MPEFPAYEIKATQASYSARSGPHRLASITIGMAPFELNGKTHDTSLRCDQIELDLDDFPALADKSFPFPANPKPGYIDASIYLFSRHVFFITKCLTFGTMGEETIPLKVEGMLDFSSSGLPEYEDVFLSVEAVLHLPLTPARLTLVAEEAVAKAAALSVRDLGKVMALLAKDPRADGWMADLGAEVRDILQTRAGG